MRFFLFWRLSLLQVQFAAVTNLGLWKLDCYTSAAFPCGHSGSCGGHPEEVWAPAACQFEAHQGLDFGICGPGAF